MNNKYMPAYPVVGNDGQQCHGLTKLGAFTAAALQGLCANPAFWQVSDPSDDWVRHVAKQRADMPKPPLPSWRRERWVMMNFGEIISIG